MGEADINLLPEDCISTILSLTSPRDVCRCSPISWAMRSISESDFIWKRFLPSDHDKFLSLSASSSVPFSSMKELYFRLCDSILIDCGSKSFTLVKSSGKKCFMLSARELSITWGNMPLYWTWKSTPESRFSETAELRDICWLEINGKINAGMLSPETTYAAYLVMKFADRAYGFDSIPSQTSVEVGDGVYMDIAYLRGKAAQKQKMECLYFKDNTYVWKSMVVEGDVKVPGDREDGWMEIELGRFFIDGGNEGEVKMGFKETKSGYLKGGLIVEGIEVRPLC